MREEFGVGLLCVPKEGRRAFLPFFKVEALLSEYKRDPVPPALSCERRGINFSKGGELTWSEPTRFLMDLQCFGQLLHAFRRAKPAVDDCIAALK